MYCNTTNSA